MSYKKGGVKKERVKKATVPSRLDSSSEDDGEAVQSQILKQLPVMNKKYKKWSSKWRIESLHSTRGIRTYQS